MKKILFCTIIFCCISLFINAQDTQKSVIKLKNGTVLSGEIVVQTENTVIFKTEDGTRYQFPASEVESIKQQDIENQINTKEKVQTNSVDTAKSDFGMMIRINADEVFKSKGIGGAAALSAELSLGMKNIAGENWFLGLGAGYENIFASPQNINLFKIFFKIQKIFLYKQQISPFAALDFGYSMISTKDWTGGIFAKATGGISIKLSQENFLLFGLNLGVQGCNTTLLEMRDNYVYAYKGTTFLPAIGISTGIIF